MFVASCSANAIGVFVRLFDGLRRYCERQCELVPIMLAKIENGKADNSTIYRSALKQIVVNFL